MARKKEVKWEDWEDEILQKYACEIPYQKIAKMLDNKTAYDCIHRRCDWLYSKYAHKIQREKAIERQMERNALLKK